MMAANWFNCTFCDIPMKRGVKTRDDDISPDKFYPIFRKYCPLKENEKLNFNCLFCSTCKFRVKELCDLNEQVKYFQNKISNILANLTATLISKVNEDTSRLQEPKRKIASGMKKVQKLLRKGIIREFSPKIILEDCAKTSFPKSPSLTLPSLVPIEPDVVVFHGVVQDNRTILKKSPTSRINLPSSKRTSQNVTLENLDSSSSSEFEGSEDEHPQSTLLQPPIPPVVDLDVQKLKPMGIEPVRTPLTTGTTAKKHEPIVIIPPAHLQQKIEQERLQQQQRQHQLLQQKTVIIGPPVQQQQQQKLVHLPKQRVDRSRVQRMPIIVPVPINNNNTDDYNEDPIDTIDLTDDPPNHCDHDYLCHPSNNYNIPTPTNTNVVPCNVSQTSQTASQVITNKLDILKPTSELSSSSGQKIQVIKMRNPAQPAKSIFKVIKTNNITNIPPSSNTIQPLRSDFQQRSVPTASTSSDKSHETTIQGGIVEDQVKVVEGTSMGKPPPPRRKQVIKVRTGVVNKVINRVSEINPGVADLVVSLVVPQVNKIVVNQPPEIEQGHVEWDDQVLESDDDNNDAPATIDDKGEDDQSKTQVKLKTLHKILEGPPGFFTFRQNWTFEAIQGTSAFKCGHCPKAKATRRKIVSHMRAHWDRHEKEKKMDEILPRFVLNCGDGKYIYCRKWSFERMENGQFKCGHTKHRKTQSTIFPTMKEIVEHMRCHAKNAQSYRKLVFPVEPEGYEKVKRLPMPESVETVPENEVGSDVWIKIGKFVYDDKWPFDQVQEGWKCNTCGWFKLTCREMVLHIDLFHVRDVWAQRRLRGKRPPRVHLGRGKYLYDFKWPYEDFVVNGKTLLKCGTCGKIEREVKYMTDHMLGAHAEIGRFSCKICNLTFLRREQLQFHRNLHGDPKFLCSTCGKRFRQSSTLISHRKVHLLKPDAVIRRTSEEVKAKRVRTQRAIKEARKLRELMSRKESSLAAFDDDAPIKCDICRRGFFHTESLRRHRTGHKPETDLPCPHCPTSFITKTQLRDHKRHFHPDLYPTPPSKTKKVVETNRSSKYRSSWRKPQHMKTRSEILALANTDNAPFKCSICQRGFYHMESMRCHKSRHRRDTDQFCPHCSLRFLSNHQLKEHVKFKHSDSFSTSSKPKRIQKSKGRSIPIPTEQNQVDRESANFHLDVAAFEII